MMSRKTYRDYGKQYEDIFRAQHNRSIALEHDGFNRFVNNAIQSGFSKNGVDASIIQYIQNISTTHSICKETGFPHITSESLERQLEKYQITVDNHRLSGHLKVFITKDLDIGLQSLKLPTESSIYLPAQRETLFQQLFDTGIPVRHLIILFLMIVYSSIPTHTNISVWGQILNKADIDVLKDPLTILGQLHEVGLDFISVKGLPDRKAELEFVSDIAKITLVTIMESRIAVRTNDIKILLFLTKSACIAETVDCLLSDTIMNRAADTRLNKVISELSHEIQIIIPLQLECLPILRITKLTREEIFNTATINFEKYAIKCEFVVSIMSVGYIVKSSSTEPTTLKQQALNFEKYSWHNRHMFEVTPVQEKFETNLLIVLKNGTVQDIRVVPDDVQETLSTTCRKLVTDYNNITPAHITHMFSNPLHLIDKDMIALYKATIVYGDAERFVFGLCPLHIRQNYMQAGCLLCSYPSLCQDIISHMMDNMDANEALEQYHGTDECKSKWLCIHHLSPIHCLRCIISSIIDDTRNPTERFSQTLIPCFQHHALCKRLVCGILEQISRSVVQVAISSDFITNADPVIGNSLLTIAMIAFLRLTANDKLEIQSIISHPDFNTSSFDFFSFLDNLSASHVDSSPSLSTLRSLMPEMIRKLNVFIRHERVHTQTKLVEIIDNSGLSTLVRGQIPPPGSTFDKRLSEFFELSYQKLLPRSDSTLNPLGNLAAKPLKTDPPIVTMVDRHDDDDTVRIPQPFQPKTRFIQPECFWPPEFTGAIPKTRYPLQELPPDTTKYPQDNIQRPPISYSQLDLPPVLRRTNNMDGQDDEIIHEARFMHNLGERERKSSRMTKPNRPEDNIQVLIDNVSKVVNRRNEFNPRITSTEIIKPNARRQLHFSDREPREREPKEEDRPPLGRAQPRTYEEKYISEFPPSMKRLDSRSGQEPRGREYTEDNRPPPGRAQLQDHKEEDLSRCPPTIRRMNSRSDQEPPEREPQETKYQENAHGYEVNHFFVNDTYQEKIPKPGTPDYCVLAMDLDPRGVRNRRDMEAGLDQIDSWETRASIAIQRKCSKQNCHDYDLDILDETCRFVRRTWKFLCEQTYYTREETPSRANCSELYPEPRDLLSTFPIHFAQRDAGLKDSHFNRLNKLNVDTVSSTLEQAYQVYSFLCSCTSMKNQFAELSQKNLVALILDRIKESTLARQVTEMIEDKLMEEEYKEQYYVYYVYKFMEDLFCDPLRNSSTVLTLMDNEKMQGRTVQSYVEALRPLCRLYVQCISPNPREQQRLLEKVLKDKLLTFLPMRVVSTLQGMHQDPGFQTTALVVLLASLKQLEQANDRRRQTTEDINFVSRTKKIHQIEQNKWEETEPIQVFSASRTDIDPTYSPEPDTINMFGLRFGDKRVMINPKMANTDEKACYKCNNPTHLSNSKDCMYNDTPLTMTPCENCKVGLHPTSKCKKGRAVRSTDVNALFQKKGKPELKSTHPNRGKSKPRVPSSRFLFRGKGSDKTKPSVNYIEFEAEEQETEIDHTPCLSPEDSSEIIAMIDWEIGQESDPQEEEEEETQE